MADYTDIPAIFNNDTLPEAEIKALEKQAQKVVSSLNETFLAGAKESAERLLSLLETARAKEPAEQAAFMKGFLFPVAHDLKGQGATFGYPLLSDLGAHLCARINKQRLWRREDLNACMQDILDMRTVLNFPPNTQNEKLKQIQTRLETKAP